MTVKSIIKLDQVPTSRNCFRHRCCAPIIDTLNIFLVKITFVGKVLYCIGELLPTHRCYQAEKPFLGQTLYVIYEPRHRWQTNKVLKCLL